MSEQYQNMLVEWRQHPRDTQATAKVTAMLATEYPGAALDVTPDCHAEDRTTIFVYDPDDPQGFPEQGDYVPLVTTRVRELVHNILREETQR